MRQTLAEAGIRVGDRREPATAKRVKRLLWHAGISAHQIARAVGTTITGFLQKNPNLPLWAAIALILESSGDYFPRRPT
jgi:hypothetical protein